VSRTALWICLLVGVVASLTVSYEIALRERAAGPTSYLAGFGWESIVIWAAATALCGGLLRAAEAIDRRGAWMNVVVWFLAAIVIQGLICSLAPFRFDKIFASDGANSFNTVAQHYTPTAMLRNFVEVRQYWPLHGQSNMPGKPILIYWLRGISKRTDVLPWLVLIVSNLGGLFVYGMVWDLFNDRRAALYALMLYVITPGKMFFFPLLNVVTPVATLLSAWLFGRWLKTSNVVYAILLGLTLYLLILWEPLGLVIGLMFSVLMLAAWSRGLISASTILWQSVAMVVGFAAAYAAMFVLFRFHMLSAVRALTGDAIKFNNDALRSYGTWVRRNLYDFLFAVGLCPAVLFVGSLLDGVVRGHGTLKRLAEPGAAVAIGVAATVIVTDLIGINRGEVVRLCIFLACFAQIPAAYVCARLETRWAIMLVVAVTLLHDALGTDMIGFIRPG